MNHRIEIERIHNVMWKLELVMWCNRREKLLLYIIRYAYIKIYGQSIVFVLNQIGRMSDVMDYSNLPSKVLALNRTKPNSSIRTNLANKDLKKRRRPVFISSANKRPTFSTHSLCSIHSLQSHGRRRRRTDGDPA